MFALRSFFICTALCLSVIVTAAHCPASGDVSVSSTVPATVAADTVVAESLVADSVCEDSVAQKLPFYKKGLIGKIYNYFDRANEPRRDKNLTLSFIGGPHYSSEEGFGIGLAGSGAYSAGGLADTITPLSNVTLKLDVTTGQMYKIAAEGYHIFVNNLYRLNYDVYFYSFKDKWWGIGYENNRNDDNECGYRRLQGSATLDFVFNLGNNIFIGPKGNFSYINARSFDKPEMLEGEAKRTFSMGAGLTFLIEQRDVPTAATRGRYLRFDLMSYPGFLANKYSFSMAELTFSTYHRLWKGGILAGNFHTRLTWGNTPWGLLSTFGGSHRMRGYWEGRYRDKNEIDITAELRQNIWHRHGIALWVGAGTIYPKFSEFNIRHVLPNAGIGYRWEFKKGVNVRLDVGFGKGEKSFNFSLNEAF